LESPAHIPDTPPAGATRPLLSLYLYQAAPNAHLNNHTMIPVGPNELRHPPLSLDLYYLLTPLSSSPEDNLVILGRCLQIMAATPRVSGNFLDSLLQPTPPEARVTINPVSLEEMTRIWSAFSKPYRISMCYLVRVVSIDSALGPQEGPPVTQSIIDLQQIVGSGS
jgi:hypothetical protein